MPGFAHSSAVARLEQVCLWCLGQVQLHYRREADALEVVAEEEAAEEGLQHEQPVSLPFDVHDDGGTGERSPPHRLNRTKTTRTKKKSPKKTMGILGQAGHHSLDCTNESDCKAGRPCN